MSENEKIVWKISNAPLTVASIAVPTVNHVNCSNRVPSMCDCAEF